MPPFQIIFLLNGFYELPTSKTDSKLYIYNFLFEFSNKQQQQKVSFTDAQLYFWISRPNIFYISMKKEANLVKIFFLIVNILSFFEDIIS